MFIVNTKAEITTRHSSIEIGTNQWNIISFSLVICILNTNLWHGPRVSLELVVNFCRFVYFSSVPTLPFICSWSFTASVSVLWMISVKNS